MRLPRKQLNYFCKTNPAYLSGWNFFYCKKLTIKKAGLTIMIFSVFILDIEVNSAFLGVAIALALYSRIAEENSIIHTIIPTINAYFLSLLSSSLLNKS